MSNINENVPDGEPGAQSDAVPSDTFGRVDSENTSEAQSAHNPARPTSNVRSNAQPNADANLLQPAPPDSQPMALTSSNSSNQSQKDSAGAAANAASPYGTRSRNKAGASRPNYAEDREVDIDYENGGLAKPNGKSTASGRALTANTDTAETERTSGINTRRISNAAPSGLTAVSSAPSVNGVPKEQIPGTSAFYLNPNSNVAAPTSKKRKAGTSGNATGGHSSSTNAPAASQATTRRASTAATANGILRATNMMSFENSQGYLKNGKLKADDGTLLGLNDHVYLICEPPGEPYYLARIMQFYHVENEPSLPVETLKVNWYYRPRDIQRKVTDTRVVFASMHSDTCPLTSLRGKCRILHRSEVTELDEYRKTKDCFWYEKLYDRYIHRYYEVIPVSQVINVPAKVKSVLDERWKFLIVEVGRGKELTSAVKSCKRCARYSASNDSVQCAVCHNTYHMDCVRPPLLKKPSRGFAWACGPCSRAQERKLEARNTPLVGDALLEAEEEFDEDEEDLGALDVDDGSGPSSPTDKISNAHQATAEQIAQAKQWPYRYLGIHCEVEDALDYDDRIYPRASTRLGPRYQANVHMWHGRPVELVKPADIKKKYIKGSSHKKDAKLSKETIAALEAEKTAKEKRPPWVMDEPPGYVRRGEDWNSADPNNTARLSFRLPTVGESSTRGGDGDTEEAQAIDPLQRERITDDYMTRAKLIAKEIGLKPYLTNFLDKALQLLWDNDFAAEAALAQMRTVNKRKDLKEPDFSKEELKRFEDGVAKFGSELHSITKHVKTQKHADIVRFYYMWKKTNKGKQIWGNYEGRKGKKEAKRAEANASKLVDDVAHDYDDSAFDNDKAAGRKRGFECKFCGIRRSPQWRRAPGVTPGTTVPADLTAKGNGKDKAVQLMLALCNRCAVLWRKYGIQWENIDEVAKKVAQGGGRAWKRRIDEELLSELVAANEAASVGTSNLATDTTASVGTPATSVVPHTQEPPKKKLKMSEKEVLPPPSTNGGLPDPTVSTAPKKKVVEKPPEPPPKPEIPKPKILPCAICNKMDPMGDQHLSCRECRMTVHRQCYGVGEARSVNKWVCDMCSNDKNPQVSTSYECVLCPVRFTEHDFVEPPRVSHKKKTDKEREKERLDRELAVEAARFYRQKQEEMNRPTDPREPLKRTAGNNWVHVTCAVWTPEMRFGKATVLEPSEGIGTVPIARYQQVCKVCKSSTGACVPCHQCHASVHVACAQQAGYTLGFDITPVKGSRRDLVNTVTLGNESGSMTAAVWCKEHVVKTIVHPMSEMDQATGLNALQLFVRNYKQADLALTGTVRKANLVNQSTKAITQAPASLAGNRRASTTNSVSGATTNGTIHVARRSSRTSPTSAVAGIAPRSEEAGGESDQIAEKHSTEGNQQRTCLTCGITVSPRWWKTRKEKQLPARDTVPQLQPIKRGPQESHVDWFARGNPAVNEHFYDEQIKPEEDLDDVAALAAAALTSDPPLTEFQCHKCHWKTVRFKDLRSSPKPPPSPPRQPDIIQLTASAPQSLPSAPLAWPQQPPQLSNGVLSPHTRVTLSPRRRVTPPPPQLNGPPAAFPPQFHHGPPQHQQQQMNGYTSNHRPQEPPPHYRREAPPPHPNGPPPQNFHPRNAPPPHHFNNTQMPPAGFPLFQNGHPSPRQGHNQMSQAGNGHFHQFLPESPHSQHQHLHAQQGSTLTAPPAQQVPRERPSTPREQMAGHGGSGSRPLGDVGRQLAGASASPSLRNLLH
ncbi:MAG: putative PHD type zinc finger protein with BAH domain-containing protein [Candelina mexicana]|nr:MAG: putative PHD type zinc finger protein with BAH domain-containing protein [Candelina mexicana]